jgi:hypothetical protein
MDLDFVEVPKVLHPGQGQLAFLDQKLKAQWIIRPHICLAEVPLKRNADPRGPVVDLCQHPNGGRFVQVPVAWLGETLGYETAAVWDANVSGDLRLKVSVIAKGQPASGLRLDFSLGDRMASAEVDTTHRMG